MEEELWALQKKEELEAKWKDSENCMLIFNRACERVRDSGSYMPPFGTQEKKLIQPKWEARVNGGFYVCPEAKPTFIIRFCGQY
ncbi:hypothetical protein HPP92_016792 [Vanilla planifolia]|uniref:Uncharacterized protein n=1 Tax=Vanilla planifolia TaxID=51239 RepID=A0A835QJW1_VANPL|nr:hypothetical protein HPP92_016792 [Vanilla planifolia]